MILDQPMYAQQDGDDLVSGTYRTLHSEILDSDRTLLIHLPSDYEESNSKYPIIVKLFGTYPAYFSNITSELDLLSSRGLIPECIFVGVDQHGHGEVIPPEVPATQYPNTGDKFLEFVSNELIPFIDGQYRTNNFRIFMGSFDCGVFGLYTLIKQPDLFNAYLINSPGRYGGSSAFLEAANEVFKTASYNNRFLHLTYAENEQEEFRQPTEKFIEFMGTNSPGGLTFSSSYLQGADYDEYTPYIYCKGSFLSLFGGFNCPQEIVQQSYASVKEYYRQLSTRLGYDIEIPYRVMDNTGNNLWRAGKLNEAEQVFLLMVQQSPTKIDAYFRLADLTRITGRYEESVNYYNKCLELNPNINVAKARRDKVIKYVNESAAFQTERAYLSGGLEAAQTRIIELSSDTAYYFAEVEFNQLGYKVLQDGRTDDAIRIFLWNTELYPNSANAFDSLGEAYVKIGDKASAIKQYEKVLELDPENENAKKMLEQLRSE